MNLYTVQAVTAHRVVFILPPVAAPSAKWARTIVRADFKLKGTPVHKCYAENLQDASDRAGEPIVERLS